MRRGVSAAAALVGCVVVAVVTAMLPAAAAATHAATSATSSTTTTSGRVPGLLPSAFSWFAPGPPPSSWREYGAVQGTVVVADPPRLKPLGGSGGSLSFAARGARGAYFAFIDVTPQQGAENLAGWAAFRLGLLRTDGAKGIHEDATAGNLPFRGGTGACVIDDYVTRAGTAFHEIACFVEGPHSGSVVVVAAPPSDWRSYAMPLERVVSSYRVM